MAWCLVWSIVAVAVQDGPAIAAADSLQPGYGNLEVSSAQVVPRQQIAVKAIGLVGDANYLVSICGNGGLGGSTYCDVGEARTATTSETGTFGVVVTVGLPPTPCPCVVEAQPETGASQASETPVTVSITIQGAPVGPVVALGAPRTYLGLRITQLRLVGSASWSERFGGPAHRTLAFTLRNAGDVVIPSTPLVISSGDSAGTSDVVNAPTVPTLEPGQTASYRIPVSFAALTWGSYIVKVVIGTTGDSQTLASSTELTPWGLIGVLIVLGLALLLLAARRVARVRRMRSARRPEAGARVPVETVPAPRVADGPVTAVGEGDTDDVPAATFADR